MKVFYEALANKQKSSYQASAERYHFLCCHLMYSCCGQISHPLEFSSWGKQGHSYYNNLKQLRMPWTPVGLRLFAPVMKAKQDWQRLCINLFFLLKHTVCCCDYPGAPNLQERNMRSSSEDACWEYDQCSAALCVHIVTAAVFIHDQGCNPRVRIFLVEVFKATIMWNC